MTLPGNAPLVSSNLDAVIREYSNADSHRREPANGKIPKGFGIGDAGGERSCDNVSVRRDSRCAVVRVRWKVDRNAVLGPESSPAKSGERSSMLRRKLR